MLSHLKTSGDLATLRSVKILKYIKALDTLIRVLQDVGCVGRFELHFRATVVTAVHNVFFPLDRAQWDISSNLTTVILLNIYLYQRARSRGTLKKFDFRESQTLNL